MREIKFRVWCKQTEEMRIVEKMGFNEDGLWYVEDEDLDSQPPYFVGNDDWELMQYSEFVDKNDNEIYEGDVLEIKNIRYLVMYSYSAFILKKLNDFDQDLMHRYAIDEMSVIGNKYENPDLINEHHVTDDLPF